MCNQSMHQHTGLNPILLTSVMERKISLLTCGFLNLFARSKQGFNRCKFKVHWCTMYTYVHCTYMCSFTLWYRYGRYGTLRLLVTLLCWDSSSSRPPALCLRNSKQKSLCQRCGAGTWYRIHVSNTNTDPGTLI